MVVYKALSKAAAYLPGDLKSAARRLYYRDRHWAHPSMKKFGTVQDLYYWVSDGNLDTLLVLQNYFSALYPALETGTHGAITFYSKDGAVLGEKLFTVAQFGGARFRVSALLEELEVSRDHSFGSLEVYIAIPEPVIQHIQDQKSVYFWDRFYIGYTTSRGQTCFVHGVDKTHIFWHGESEPYDWNDSPEERQWAPEMPVNIEDYEKFNVIMINRSAQPTDVTLTLSDTDDISESWSAEIPSKGLHRFELTGKDTAALAPTELRMRVQGMASRYGRPMVFKEFSNGAISAMHC